MSTSQDEQAGVEASTETRHTQEESTTPTPTQAEVLHALRANGAIDADVCNAVLDALGPQGPVEERIAWLKGKKPYLFRRHAAAMAPHATNFQPEVKLDRLLEAARESGERSALFRYLRARRGSQNRS